MRIELFCGVDDLYFGMSEPEIVTALGKPNKIIVSEQGNRDLCYFNQKLVLKVEPENDARLGWIEVHNRQARWLNVDPWTLSRESLLGLLTKELHDTYHIDDYGIMESYSFNKNWIELQYELGDLVSFNFGVPYDSNDKPLWPHKNA